MTTVYPVAYIALFVGVGAIFLFAILLIGKFLRPHNPHPEKLEVYECGEPTIGSSFVQFDLRFYVVALLFLIFDVEVALFFPWANVYGKANSLADPHLHAQVTQRAATPGQVEAHHRAVVGVLTEMGVPREAQPNPADTGELTSLGRRLAGFAILDISVFFAVLMVGFAYVWSRGDLDWVRALSQERAARAPPSTGDPSREPALSA